MEDDNPNSSILALKIIMALSLILVFMDALEVYFSYISLKSFSLEFNTQIFEECIKYHVLAQIIFTIFAAMAGLSAFLMSAGLLISHDFFALKIMESFVNFNYNIFGPFLFTMSIVGFGYYEKVIFFCDRDNFSSKHVNYSTLLALLICLFLSFFITFLYAFLEGYNVMIGSIRFNRSGYKFLGKLFWKYVFTRRRDEYLRSNSALDQQFMRLYNSEANPHPSPHQNQDQQVHNQGDINSNLIIQNDLENNNNNDNNNNHLDNENDLNIMNNDLREPFNTAFQLNIIQEIDNSNEEDLSKINFNDKNVINNIAMNKNIFIKDNAANSTENTQQDLNKKLFYNNSNNSSNGSENKVSLSGNMDGLLSPNYGKAGIELSNLHATKNNQKNQ